MKLWLLWSLLLLPVLAANAKGRTLTPITSSVGSPVTNTKSAVPAKLSNVTFLNQKIEPKIQTITSTRPATESLKKRLLVGFYFGLWYALNVYYNIINKKILNVLPAPLTVGSLQLGVGSFYVAVLWLTKLRPRPSLTSQGRPVTRSIGLWHAIGQEASMVSLGAGPVSFTHIVKALEPFFSAVVSGIVVKKWMSPVVYATLIPVVGGVGYACLKEHSFSWLAFWMAMLSNLAFALRAVLSKTAMAGSDLGTHLTSPNVFGLVTISSFWISIPLALLGEGWSFPKLWTAALESYTNAFELILAILYSGLFHYLNNEVMYLALGQVHPITLAVGNTMKRVFIILASVVVFRNTITIQTAVGSTIGLIGVLLYSLAQQYYQRDHAAIESGATTVTSTSKK